MKTGEGIERHILQILFGEGKTQAFDELGAMYEEGYMSSDTYDRIYNLIRWF